MAHVETTMAALGAEQETCTGCDRRFERGETMHAVVCEDGSPAGWYCGRCIHQWNERRKAEGD